MKQEPVRDETLSVRSPEAELRRRAAYGLLHLLLVVLLLRAAVEPALRPRQPWEAPPPLVVDLARDPAWRLALLPGVGPARARALIEDREQNGAPRAPDDLLRVPGLGPAFLAALRATQELRVHLDGRAWESFEAGAER